MKKIILPIIILSLLFGTGVLAQEAELPDPSLTPDSPFYFLDTLGEKIGMFFTFGAEKKAKKAFQYAGEKLAEVKVMAGANKIEALKKAGQKYQEYLALFFKKGGEAYEEGKDVTELEERSKQRSLDYLRVLSDAHEEALEEAKAEVEKIIKVSRESFGETIWSVHEEQMKELREEKIEEGPEIEKKPEGPKIEEEIEILKDTKFEWGFANKFPHSNLPENKRCEMSVQGKKPIWRTAEIATETHFCNNLPNPKSTNPIIFESKEGYKKLYSYRDGRIKLQLDSSAEENQGCRITNDITPESNWIHYGVVQDMLVDFANFEELNFNADVKLNKFQPKIPNQDCKKYGAPVEKYGEFVIVFLLQRKDDRDAPGNLFWLLLAPCSKHKWLGAKGENIPCTSNLEEYIQRDQFGIAIYHPPMGNKHPILKEGGQWATYRFDLKKLAKDAVNYHNSQYDPDINLYDYNLVHVNLGWEIMGAFDTEIELRNLSLTSN